MRFTKTYKCPKCGYTFTKVMTSTFIKTSMPQCPSCGGNKIKIDNKIEKKKNK